LYFKVTVVTISGQAFLILCKPLSGQCQRRSKIPQKRRLKIPQ
jgi:hypothetical protein